MMPVVALVGRPNVGKSTLFNALTKTKNALVIDQPGVTRDRQYGQALANDKPYIVIDTGGLSGDEEGIDAVMVEQVQMAIEESDLVLFLVDGREGLNAQDEAIAKNLRGLGKKVMLLVNKTDGLDEDIALSEFYGIGFDQVLAIAASHRRGVTKLVDEYIDPICPAIIADAIDKGIKIGLIGRPNVGKSTLANRMLGEDRVIVYDQPGTTRDSIYIPFERHGQKYTIIDTAGLRRKGKTKEIVEKFSVVKTLQAIADANVVVCVLDSVEGITDQDMHVMGFAIDSGRAMVIAINKWDGLDEYKKNKVQMDLERRFDFLKYVRVHFISALHGTNVGHIYKSVHEAFDAAFKEISTADLNRALESALEEFQPPLVRGRRVKLRYAHMGGHNPPLIIIHGNQTERLIDSYKRYLMNYFRKTFKLMGTPLKIELKTTENPFEGRRNKLTPRQEYKKKRTMKRFKKK